MPMRQAKVKPDQVLSRKNHTNSAIANKMYASTLLAMFALCISALSSINAVRVLVSKVEKISLLLVFLFY